MIRKRKKKHKRPVFAVKFDPRLPSISPLLAKHWRSMTFQDQYMKEVFPEPPLTAFKRQKNLRDLLIRARVPPPPRAHTQRANRGMSRCEMSCTACPYVKPGKQIRISENRHWTINRSVSCQSFNVIYLIQCNKDSCRQKYIGETGRIFKFRLDEHRGYITNKVESQATGRHFNLPGHSLANLEATVIEQVQTNTEAYRKQREHFYIRKFNTFHQGMNQKK